MISYTTEQNNYLYPAPMDMRKDIDSLSDIVCEEMRLDPTRLNGVFIFIARNRRLMKILYRGLHRFELTKIRLDKDKFLLPVYDEERNCYRLSWSDFVTITESVSTNEIENKFNFYINSGSFHKLGKLTQTALKYIKNEWASMKNVLTFGDAELSNNLCEQMMRHIKTNLKNSQNIGSEDAAGNFCFMYSLVESCGFNLLSPIRYIPHLLKTLPTLETTAERRNLLPCYCQL